MKKPRWTPLITTLLAIAVISALGSFAVGRACLRMGVGFDRVEQLEGFDEPVRRTSFPTGLLASAAVFTAAVILIKDCSLPVRVVLAVLCAAASQLVLGVIYLLLVRVAQMNQV